MALELKASLGTEDKVAKKVAILDATGAYHPADNTGGYGNPNHMRSSVRVYLVAEDSAGKLYLGAGDPQTAETFVFHPSHDGTYVLKLVAFPGYIPTSVDAYTIMAEAALISSPIHWLCVLYHEAEMIKLLDADMADRSGPRRNRNRYTNLSKALVCAKGHFAVGNPREADRVIQQLQNIR